VPESLKVFCRFADERGVGLIGKAMAVLVVVEQFVGSPRSISFGA
jgi:hypothetical protein